MRSILERAAKYIDVAASPVARGMNTAGAMVVVVMMFWVTTDVFLRKFFSSGLPGTMPLVEMMLAIVVFFGAAYCQIQLRHVRINLIVPKFPPLTQVVIDSITYILTTVVIAIMLWRTGVYVIAVFITGEIPLAIDIPIWPAVALVTIGIAVLLLILTRDLLSSLAGVWKIARHPLSWFLLILAVSVGLIGIPAWLNMAGIEMPFIVAGFIGITLMVVLFMLRMPIAFAMIFIGFIGFWYLRGFDPTMSVFMNVPYGTATTFLFTVLPFFILMGLLCYHAGISEELYRTANTWVGHQPGGLAMATIGGCAGFAAICGDSLATAATMGTISIPEMKKFKYDSALATGSVAAGGTLGILIPPSIGFIIYGLITEVNIGKLFIAGIVPGILLAGMFMLVIYIRCRINPTIGPRGDATTFRQKLLSLKDTWAVLVLFLFVMGGIYLGWFTPTEAGALGASGALVIALARRKLIWKNFHSALLEAGQNTSMIILILVGVFVLGYFFSMSEIPLRISEGIRGLDVSRYVILTLILLLYLFLGMIMNIIPMIMITLPIFFPTIVGLGFDPIWFGVIMVIMMEMGQITPPVGVNVYVIAGVAKDVPMGTIFKGILPFWVVECLILVILTFIPQIALFLPNLMMD